MAKEAKTARELEDMILQEANNWRLRVSVRSDPPTGWHVSIATWGDIHAGVLMKVKEIAERLRTQYDLKEE